MNKELKEFFGMFSSQVSEIAIELFNLASPILTPTKKMWLDIPDKLIVFGTEKTMKGEICYIKPLKDSVNLGFFHGAKISDPNNLLIGTGKSLRHIKFKNIDEINHIAINEIIENALTEHNERQT
jgi:hypothetical protein